MTTTQTSGPELRGFWGVADVLFERLQEAGAALAVSETVPPEVESALEALVQALPEAPESLGAADPYLVSALYASAMRGLDALRDDDPRQKRRNLRGPLERTRQALRDLIVNEPVMDDKTAKQIVTWLVELEEIPIGELARVLGVTPATLRRWADPKVEALPKGPAARRLRVLAKVVNQLRWSFSPGGVIEWLERPHPALKGEEPKTLLADPGGGPTLFGLAGSTRSMTLT
jgi:DNA-binding transcriptional ArsR family regulator